jgi:hypothetical protein
MKAKKLPNWYDVYPAGTKEGDEESAFFISLSRNKKYVWRSTAGIAQDTGLSKERVEEIIDKYFRQNMVYQHPKNDDNWGYWERIPPEMLPQEYQSLVKKDQKQRIKKSK